MEAKPLGYWRIQKIVEILQSGGLQSAFVYIGADQMSYKCLNIDRKPAPSIVDDKGLVDFEVGLIFTVNLDRPRCKMLVTVEDDDTYRLRLWRPAPLDLYNAGRVGEVLADYENIHYEDLRRFVKETYDEWFLKIHGNFIPPD